LGLVSGLGLISVLDLDLDFIYVAMALSLLTTRPFFSLFSFLSPQHFGEQLTLYDQRQFQRITKSDFGQIGKWSMANSPTVSSISGRER
jgi:hypothetical protein